MKWMVPGDWAQSIGLVRYAIALADCSKEHINVGDSLITAF